MGWYHSNFETKNKQLYPRVKSCYSYTPGGMDLLIISDRDIFKKKYILIQQFDQNILKAAVYTGCRYYPNYDSEINIGYMAGDQMGIYLLKITTLCY